MANARNRVFRRGGARRLCRRAARAGEALIFGSIQQLGFEAGCAEKFPQDRNCGGPRAGEGPPAKEIEARGVAGPRRADGMIAAVNGQRGVA